MLFIQSMKLLFCSLFTTLCWSWSYSAISGDHEFGDWVLHCDTDTQICSISQVAKIEGSGETVMQLNLIFDHSVTPVIRKVVFVLPLGTALDTPPTLYIANGPVGLLQALYCLQNGCYYSLPLSSTLLDRFLSMFSGHVEVQSNFGDTLKIPITGAGTRAAFNFYQERF